MQADPSSQSNVRHTLLLLLLIATILTNLALFPILLRKNSGGSPVIYNPKREESCPRHPRCLFIVSPGRSGSTALLDAMNQMDKVFIRGENAGMFKFLFNLHYVALRFSSQPREIDAAEELRRYHKHVLTRHKPAWYNEFNPAASLCATRSYFRRLFGYGDFDDYIVGFKEIRFWGDVNQLIPPGNSIGGVWHKLVSMRLSADKFEDFELYMDFHRHLCEKSQIVFNHRKHYNFTKGHGFYMGKERGKKLQRNIEFAERYSALHPNDTMTVYFEDMFNKNSNQTLLENLGKFMRKKTKGITFARLPRE